MRSYYRWSGVSLLALAALLFSLGISAAGAWAQTPAGSDASVLTIPAGQTAQVQVRGFCLDYGKQFPSGVVSPKELSTPELRAALNYAIQKGYVDSNPGQVQEALWFLSDGTWHADEHQLAQEIVDNSKSAAPADPAGGTTLFNALAGGGLTAEVTFTPKSADAFYGDGTLTIRNTGSSDAQVYLPIGTVFPPATPDQQRLLGYAIQVTQAAPTATAEPSMTTNTTGQTLPGTGGPEDTNPAWLLLALALLTCAGGVALLRRSSQRA